MKGELHVRLQALLHRAWKDRVLKQDSVAAVMEKSQKSVSQYLRGDDDAGALDLDEAAAALAHIGSNLPDFLKGAPPRELTEGERLAHALDERPALKTFVTDLLLVPKTQLVQVLPGLRLVARGAIPRRAGRSGGSPGASRLEARTKSESRKRR